jgi:hypothetical protein
MSGSYQEAKPITVDELKKVVTLKAKQVNSPKQREAAALLDIRSAEDVRKHVASVKLALDGIFRCAKVPKAGFNIKLRNVVTRTQVVRCALDDVKCPTCSRF